jgi:tRNA 2-thiouridine synthesizing protein A
MQTLDARGKSCPMPIVLTAKAMKALAPGDRLLVLANDRAFPEDVKAWCTKTGNDLVSLAQNGDHFEAEVRRAR